MSDEDRTRYFAALEVVHREDLSTGKALYGNDFRNYAYFTAKVLMEGMSAATSQPR